MNGERNLSSSNEWELSKENVQPLKQGRKVAPLTAALAPSSFDYQSKIHKEKQVFESEIRTYEGDDFLDVWHRYILWMSETYPTGVKEMSMLLERCIATFKDQEKYRDDERYLKIWIHYADICSDPIEIFNYMYSHNVFSLQALFYESWAVVLENKGDLKRADEVFRLGIQRDAQPLDRLKRQHRAFETRLAENIQTDNRVNHVENAGHSEAQRISLGGLAHKKGIVGAKRTGNASLPSKGGIGQVRQKSNSKGGFAIFVDENPGQSSGLPAAAGGWQEPPTQSIITRENTQKPGKWTNNKCSQRHQPATPLDSTNQKPSFTVHVDEDAPCPPRTPQPSFPGMSSVLSSRKPEKQTTIDPLKIISKVDVPDNSQFKVMYCKEKVYAGVEEYSFEEIRAAAIFSRIRNGTWPAQPMEEEPTPNIQYKEMYPKKEVYNFVEELQWEEVRAKHYFARLAQKKDTVVPTVGAPEVHVQSERSLEQEPMDLSSCQKAQSSTERLLAAPASAQVEYTCQGPQVRRGLSFTGPSEQGLAATQSAAAFAVRSFSCDPAPGDSLSTSGTESAFKPVQRSFSRPEPPVDSSVAGQHGLSTSRDALYSSVLDSQDLRRAGASTFGNAPAPTHVTAIASSASTPFSSATQTSTSGNATSNHVTTITSSARTLRNAAVTDLSYTSSARAPGAPLSLVTQTSISGNAASTHVTGITSSARALGAPFSLVTPSSTPVNAPISSAHPSRTPDNLGEQNSSWLSGPSPTVNTRQAMAEVMAMFNNTLEVESEFNWNNKLNEDDKEFEDAFDNLDGHRTSTAGVGTGGNGGGIGFVIYDETIATEQENLEDVTPAYENQENRPPNGYLQAQHRRPLTGVLQPSVGIPVSSEDSDEEERNFVEAGQENAAPDDIQTIAASLPDEAANITTASSDFSAMARMASTPFSLGFDPPTLPTIPCSTIRPNVEANKFLVRTENDSNENPASYDTFAQASGIYVCTPLKKLSPIMEKSNEDVNPVASSSSQSSIGFQFKENGTTDINPFANDVENLLLAKVVPSVSTYEGFYQSQKSLPKIAADLAIDLGMVDLYRVKNVAGSGAFAKVYKAIRLDMDRSLEDFNWDDSMEFALKVSKIPATWEFYMCRQLHERIDKIGLPRQMHCAFMNPPSIYVYANGSVLVDQYLGHGTLLDIVNKYKSVNASMTESMAVYYTIDLLRAVDTAHRCGIIHGDIKPDNFLVLDSYVSAEGEEAQSLRLIDFGRSIDMELFPPGTSFTVNCYTDTFQCIEMKTRRPWSTQVDSYGLLATVHCLIHGEYMNVFEEGGKWHPTKSVKRHWNYKLWNKLYDTLLNIPNCQQQPSLKDLCCEFMDYHETTMNAYHRDKKRHDIMLFNM